MQVFGVQEWDFEGERGVEIENGPGDTPLGRDVLRDVSRSFYLSLRCLPRGFREPASLGYLLARLSDTIADAGTLPVEERVELLKSFGGLVAALPARGGRADEAAFEQELAEGILKAGLSKGEQVLVARTADVLATTSALDPALLASVVKVVGIIVGGQQWDLTRFVGEECVALKTEAELEQYAYAVAGCVGEFWTEVAFAVMTNPARELRDQMMEWGRNFGKGLQLVNILRDVPEDLQRGRCYLPGVDPGDRAALLEKAAEWRTQARDWLQDGFRYVDALRGVRLKIASGLPAVLGVQTLDLLDRASWEDLERGVKVTRKDVKKAMARAAACSSPFLPGSWAPEE